MPIRLSELTDEQLQRTGLLVSIAPARAYSGDEQRAPRTFVEHGGIWVCMAGADSSGPLNDTLSAFGLSVPPTHLGAFGPSVDWPAVGYAARPYFHSDDYDAYVIFDSAWPVHCPSDNTQVLAREARMLPVVASTGVGNGRIILIGDRLFAANRNLESQNGAIVDGVRENAGFWRWLIAGIRDGQEWLPPNIPLPKAGGEGEEDGESAEAETPAEKLPSEKVLPDKLLPGKTPAGKGLGAGRLLGTRPKSVPAKEATP